MEPAEVLVLALLGGVLALDGTSVGQFMLSRPLVASILAGLAVGDPAAGAMVGMVLEALHIAVLPVGAARYPEAAPASVAAAGVDAGGGGEALLLAVVLFALGWEWVGSWSVSRLRESNVRFAALDGSPVAPEVVERRHLAAIVVDFARGVTVTALGILLLYWLARALPLGSLPDGWSPLALGLAGAAAVASSLRLFGRKRLAWFAAGAAAGMVFLVAR